MGGSASRPVTVGSRPERPSTAGVHSVDRAIGYQPPAAVLIRWAGLDALGHHDLLILGGIGSLGGEVASPVGVPVGPADAEAAAERRAVGLPVAAFLAHGHPFPRRALVRGHRVDGRRCGAGAGGGATGAGAGHALMAAVSGVGDAAVVTHSADAGVGASSEREAQLRRTPVLSKRGRGRPPARSAAWRRQVDYGRRARRMGRGSYSLRVGRLGQGTDGDEGDRNDRHECNAGPHGTSLRRARQGAFLCSVLAGSGHCIRSPDGEREGIVRPGFTP